MSYRTTVSCSWAVADSGSVFCFVVNVVLKPMWFWKLWLLEVVQVCISFRFFIFPVAVFLKWFCFWESRNEKHKKHDVCIIRLYLFQMKGNLAVCFLAWESSFCRIVSETTNFSTAPSGVRGIRYGALFRVGRLSYETPNLGVWVFVAWKTRMSSKQPFVVTDVSQAPQ